MMILEMVVHNQILSEQIFKCTNFMMGIEFHLYNSYTWGQFEINTNLSSSFLA